GSKIENLTNSGSVLGGNGIQVSGSQAINTLTNHGIISGEGSSGIKLNSYSSVQFLKNSGTIKGFNDGMFLLAGTINNLDNSGVIFGNQNGIKLEKSGNHVTAQIANLNNTGSIIGKNNHGIYILGSQDSLHTLTNSIHGYIYGGYSGIRVSGEFGIPGKISTINNQGTIIGGKYGIELFKFNNALASTIENITNKGVILGQSAGIYLQSNIQY
ncbi:hypothetical protein CAMP5053_08300, partial [Campylobacter sp. S4:11]|nr:hypothetical protein [Campylobacter sp. S4:11]